MKYKVAPVAFQTTCYLTIDRYRLPGDVKSLTAWMICKTTMVKVLNFDILNSLEDVRVSNTGSKSGCLIIDEEFNLNLAYFMI